MHNRNQALIAELDGISRKFEEFSIPHWIFFSGEDMLESVRKVQVVLRAYQIHEGVRSLYNAPQNYPTW